MLLPSSPYLQLVTPLAILQQSHSHQEPGSPRSLFNYGHISLERKNKLVPACGKSSSCRYKAEQNQPTMHCTTTLPHAKTSRADITNSAKAIDYFWEQSTCNSSNRSSCQARQKSAFCHAFHRDNCKRTCAVLCNAHTYTTTCEHGPLRVGHRTSLFTPSTQATVPTLSVSFLAPINDFNMTCFVYQHAGSIL